MSSLFGDVIVHRKSYSKRKHACCFPLDEQLNLPNDQYSDGLRQLIVDESVKGSFDNVVESLKPTTGGRVAKRRCLNVVQGGRVAKRRCLNVVQGVAQDFEQFYAMLRIEREQERVIGAFEEAPQRDPNQERQWVIIVDAVIHIS